MESRNTAETLINIFLKVFLISNMRQTRYISYVQTNTLCQAWFDCRHPGKSSNYTVSLFPQGVEFFDEKLNTLCMAWLIDHGKTLSWVKVFQGVISDINKLNS